MDFFDLFWILYYSVLDFYVFFLFLLLKKKLAFNFFLELFWIFFGFFRTIVSLFKVTRLLLKVTKVTIKHQNWPEMGQNSIKNSLFFP